MKYISAVPVFAALAAGAAVPAEITTTQLYQVTDFAASCTPHSVMCSYSFGVIGIGDGETIPVKCGASIVGGGHLPNVTDGTCEESSRTFDVKREADGSLVLFIGQPVTPTSNEWGKYTVPADQIELETTGATQQERYVGPTSFVLNQVW